MGDEDGLSSTEVGLQVGQRRGEVLVLAVFHLDDVDVTPGR